MKFYSIDNSLNIGKNGNGVYLIHTSWDDWFEFEITYEVWFFEKEKKLYIGSIKIGSFEMKEGQRYVELPETFEKIPSTYFSLGTDEAYYIELNTSRLKDHRETILYGLNDVALYKRIHLEARKTRVYDISVTRSVSESNIEGRFRRLANGDATLSNYDFSFCINNQENAHSLNLEFKVIQNQVPPSHIHSIIGRNGVGKSFLLNQILEALIEKNGNFTFSDDYSENQFSNLLSVNFSSFENKKNFENNDDPKKGIVYYHLNPNSSSKEKIQITMQDGKEITIDGFSSLFIESLTNCLTKKPKRWLDCITVLNSDPVFKSINVSDLYKNYLRKEDYTRNAYNLFDKLSSGHKIVLLTLTKLIELSEEKTLIIMDEPEMHLHPPLLGSFIRSLSSLLKKINGVAILATHSPIILQEVPKDCVYKLNRFGNILKAERPKIETFGEEIGLLTSEVFGLEVTESGFHQLLKEYVDKGMTYDEIEEEFNHRLSRAASGTLRILLATKDS